MRIDLDPALPVQGYEPPPAPANRGNYIPERQMMPLLFGDCDREGAGGI